MKWLTFPPILMLLIFAPAALGYRYLAPADRPPFLIFGIRWFLGILFLISGLAKLIPHFPNTMGPVNLEFTLAPHGLAFFARFIAVVETATGLMLLTRRWTTLGALLLVPMLISILIITSTLHWQGTPYVVSVFLLLTLLLLGYDYRKLLPLIDDRAVTSTGAAAGLRPLGLWLGALGLITGMLLVIRFTSPAHPGVWGLVAALAGLIIWDWRRPPTR